MGKNQTGIDTAGDRSKVMIETAERISPPNGDPRVLEFRQQVLSSADRIGSVPPPASFKGMAMSLKDKLTGKKPEVFMDKLGERLAFERSGVRLYELMIEKVQVAPSSIVSVDKLREIRDEEYAHFHLVAETLESMGGDSTAITPAANVIAVASEGIVKVVSDPRTTVPQCITAIETIELIDNAGWDVLIQIADGLGLDDTASQFRNAFAREQEHLQTVRQWCQQLALTESGVA